MNLLRELLTCSHNLWLWTYSPAGMLDDTNCPDREKLSLFFRHAMPADLFPLTLPPSERSGFRNKSANAPESAEPSEDSNADFRHPVVLSNSFGLFWIIEPEYNDAGAMLNFYSIGPAFITEVSIQSVSKSLDSMQISLSMRHAFLDTLRKLPVIPIMHLLEYGMMAHYCVTGKKISIADLRYSSSADELKPSKGSAAEFHAASHNKKNVTDADKTDNNSSVQPARFTDRVNGTWAMEQQLMKLIEEGNLDYKKVIGNIMTTGDVGNFSKENSIRYIQDMNIIYTALCTRAAIRGGLSPETAYSMSDRYISWIESCAGVSDIAEVNAAMQDDFVHRVRNIRSSGGLSAPVQNCRNYIENNLGNKLSRKEISSVLGYSAGQLERKFKNETGETISKYILSARIERAKDLLLSGNQPVQEISGELGFTSFSYFCKQFREITGLTPGRYRSGHHE